MKILILGNDGYIGYPLTLHLLKQGHEVFGGDNYSRRKLVNQIGGNSLTPISSRIERNSYLKTKFSNFVDQTEISLGEDFPQYIRSILEFFLPDAIVHLAEMPSAPWSMIDAERSGKTQLSNVIGTLHLIWAIKETCPNTHLIKLGSMGEYGTPPCDIPEGTVPQKCLKKDSPTKCPMGGLLFPRKAGSFYHLSKVHDTYNIEFACRIWGLRSTDIMQGIVYGLDYESGPENEEEMTRFDYDQFFGTVINRFCTQTVVGYPITIYGEGTQTRGFIPLKDSIKCITLALENPPEEGEYRTLNQFENIYQINSVANIVSEAAESLGLNPTTLHINNPRIEDEDHYYNPECQKLFNLGYIPSTNILGEVSELLSTLLQYKDRVIKEVIMPTVQWDS